MAHPGPILIVDDEASIRKSLEGVLSDEGYSCALASDGADALSQLESLRPSLVILDIWMPGMDGIETLRRMKAAQPETPVIMMSGHATISTAIKATKVGASDFIEKPLELDVVLNAIRRALGTQDAVRSPAAGELAGSIDLRSPEGMPELQPSGVREPEEAARGPHAAEDARPQRGTVWAGASLREEERPDLRAAGSRFGDPLRRGLRQPGGSRAP